jgi:succinate dehydrogenase/fumarate reductase flavoprotein subunit
MKDGNASKKLSRRNFLKVSAGGALGITTVNLLSSCSPKVSTPAPTAVPEAAGVNDTCEPWYGVEPVIADSEIVETIDTDILICGAGHGGLTAAVAATDFKVKTLVIEKNPTIGTYRTYNGAIDSACQLAAGVKINKTEIVNEMARYGSNHVDQKLIRVWADESGKTFDWLAEKLASLGIINVAEYDIGNGYHGIYKCWPTHTNFISKEKSENSMMNDNAPILQKVAETAGVVFRFNTSMVKVIREGDKSGKATGVIAKNKEGNFIKINASKGILIATGGYADDAELLNRLNPCAANVSTLQLANPGTKGDGLKAGIWAGGQKDVHPATMIFDRGVVKPGEKAGIPFKYHSFDNYFQQGSQPFLKVNMKGERYCCESAPYDFVLYPLENDGHGVFAEIWDSDYWAQVESFHTIGCSRLVPSTSEPKTGEGMGKEILDKMIAGQIAGGWVQQADTIEDLAKKLLLPPDSLKKTIDRYNELAANGVDEDFGKPTKDLLPLSKAPYFGAIVGAYLLTTMDGLQINTDMQVLDSDRQPIEGLYATGDVAGGFFAHNYPELAVGIASGKTMTFARHAIMHMVGG